jgi:hypothetical protein
MQDGRDLEERLLRLEEQTTLKEGPLLLRLGGVRRGGEDLPKLVEADHEYPVGASTATLFLGGGFSLGCVFSNESVMRLSRYGQYGD